MRIINLNESQFKRLFERSGEIIEGNDTTAYIGNKETAIGGETVTDMNGDEEMSGSLKDNEFGDMIYPQYGWNNKGF